MQLKRDTHISNSLLVVMLLAEQYLYKKQKFDSLMNHAVISCNESELKSTKFEVC